MHSHIFLGVLWLSEAFILVLSSSERFLMRTLTLCSFLRHSHSF